MALNQLPNLIKHKCTAHTYKWYHMIDIFSYAFPLATYALPYMSSILALIIISSKIQSPSIPNVITEAIESGSSRMSSLFIERVTDDIMGKLDNVFTTVVA